MNNETMTSTAPSAFETGSTGIYHLKRFWWKVSARISGLPGAESTGDEWNTDIALLDALGLGLEQTLTYLGREEPSFEEFENWVVQTTGGISQEVTAFFNNDVAGLHTEDRPPASIFTADELAFWQENGYIIIRNAIPQEECRAAEQAVWDFLGMDRDDPDTWYRPHPARQGIMIQFFQHPALQSTRLSTKIRAAHEQLWGTSRLRVSTDRVSFNPPETERWHFPGPHLHWDVSLDLPIPFGLQGLLYLSDTEANQGAFTLVPGFQHRVEQWLHSLPEGADPRKQDFAALGARPIAAKAGDFILWDQALPHGSSPNSAARPRIVQYINWRPVDRLHAPVWK